jgi:Icc-related predicted phosphoesterase
MRKPCAIPGLVVDNGCFENEHLRILSFPWWEEEDEMERVSALLKSNHRTADPRPVFWVHHAPPRGARTSWNGKRDLGDGTLLEWIEAYQPTLVLSGHVHNAPYYPEGSWIDRIGNTVVINGGKQIGETPATIEIELENGALTWCGMEGCQEASLWAG